MLPDPVKDKVSPPTLLFSALMFEFDTVTVPSYPLVPEIVTDASLH